MIPFINIHTHFAPSDKNVFSIQNFTQNEWKNLTISEFGVRSSETTIPATEIRNLKSEIVLSVGLHPWFLTKENGEKDLETLAELLKNPNVLAVGECGLDKIKGESLDVQTTFFEAQICLAEAVRKPVIIHCVRAFNEIIAVKKRLKPSVPLVIHGFNKKGEILSELLKNGFYISIGHAILRGSDDFKKNVSMIPLDKLFFETDDKDEPIQSIYETYAELAEIDLNDLKSVVYNNFKSIFPKQNHR